MKTIFHQFEIRFNPILNFPQVIKGLLAPYSRIFPRINITKENSVNEKITFIQDQEYYNLIIHWDRLVIQYEGEPKSFLSSNSIFQDPYLEIFKKIENLQSFTGLADSLFYSIALDVDMQNNIEKSVQEFKEKCLSERLIRISDKANDVAVVFEYETDKYFKRVDYGPYLGSKDLVKRNVKVTKEENTEIIDFCGKIFQFKYVDKKPDAFNFKYYKDIVKVLNQEMNKYE